MSVMETREAVVGDLDFIKEINYLLFDVIADDTAKQFGKEAYIALLHFRNTLIVSKNKEPIGLFTFSSVTSSCYEVHMVILPKFRKGLSAKFPLAALQLLKAKGVDTVIGFVPSKFQHIKRFWLCAGGNIQGSIPNAVVYNKVKQDLIIFTKEL